MESKKMLVLVKTELTSGLLVLVFYSGINFGQTKSESYPTTGSKVNINTNIAPTVEYLVPESRVIRYVEKPVPVVEYIEQVKKVPLELRNFDNLEELIGWLWEKSAKTNTVYFQTPDNTIDCDDYAIALQQKALAVGYLISLEIIETTEYNGLFKNSKLVPDNRHAINLVIISNDAYYIEPQTGEVVFALHLD